VPLDFIYGSVALARRRWFERHPEARRQLRQPVISVGNLSVGGTGKTPLVAEIAAWLIARGERPAILSRGYRRRHVADGAVIVSDGASILADVEVAGDEPLMLARQVPRAVVAVSEDRYVAGVIAERSLGATVHVLDDGFQHVQLARDFDILVTSPGEIGKGHVLPRGRLREPIEAAARAHFVVVVGADRDTARTESWELGVSAYSSAQRRIADALVSTSIAVAGIAAPEQFFSLLRQSGFPVAQTLAFADHHRYNADDVRRIAQAVRSSGASHVVTTAKDAVRFESVGQLPFALTVVPMQLVLDDWEALATSLADVIERKRQAA
jgi:tetraacyldisaccharide 4'-kinase